MFKQIKCEIPSESAARLYTKEIAEKKIESIKNIILNEYIFIIIDESQLNNKKIVNILVGTLKKPNISYLVQTCNVEKISSQVIIHLIDDIIKKLNIERSNFLLLLSDAARYMTHATPTLKIIYPHLSHVTCILHLLHNCCLKLKMFFPLADNLIARIKGSTAKNRSRNELFKTIGYPPETIICRWGSWLRSTFYYIKNFPQIKMIVDNFEDSGVIVRKAKEAVNEPGVERELTLINKCYGVTLDALEKLEGKEINIENAVKIVTTLRFFEDPCKLKVYIEKRLNRNDIKNIVNDDYMSGKISPEARVMLWNCQPTTIDVERSFSMLGKLLRKERNFKDSNINNYMVIYYNSN